MKRDDLRIVYTTGVPRDSPRPAAAGRSVIGERCPNCQRPVRECVCKRGTPGKISSGPVRVSRETQGRKGKGVTVITGLGLPPDELEALAAELKKRCGSGGSSGNGRIEIQGDHRDRLVEELTRRGWPAKRAGG